MTGYYLFYLFLILGVASLVILALHLLRANYETPAPILFFLSIIGLSCNYAEWVRIFSAMYKIVWWG